MNPFENYALLKYSNKITRVESKRILIKNELMNNPEIKPKYENFEKGYNAISDKALKYGCKQLEKIKRISSEDPIAYILNDNGELGYGMYIAAAYQKFFEYQNNFLNPILGNIDLTELKYFKNQIQKEILPQKATKLEVVSFDIQNDIFDSFDELISSYSFRKCINKDNKIFYENYREIEYDYKKIEIELGKILLPGKRKFAEKQIFIIYAFEGYVGENSNAIKIFNDNYPPKKIDDNIKKEIRNDLNEADYKEILFNLQLLIFHYQNKKNNIDSSSSLSQAIENLPNIIIIPHKTKEFIRKRDLKIYHLIDLYEFIEYLSYRLILENVLEIYKNKLTEQQKKNIDDFFNNNKIITRSQFATTIRKYISRYLSGTKQIDYQNENINILDIISLKEELWDKNIYENKENQDYLNQMHDENDIEDTNFDKMIEKMQKSFNVEVSNAVDLYEYLGEDIKDFGEVEQLNSNEIIGNNVNNQDNIRKRKRGMNY